MTIAAIIASKGGKVFSVTGEDRVGEVVATLDAQRIGAVPVMDGGKVVGIFSERDVIRGLARDGAAVLGRPVREVMTAPAISVAPDHSILAALALMTARRIRHLPVVEGSAMVGFISIGDLVKLRIDKIEAEAQAMRDYISGA